MAETATAVAGISAEHGDAPFYLFRRVNGHMHLPALRIALDQHVAEQTVGTVGHDQSVIAA